jgi:hypothetical protein
MGGQSNGRKRLSHLQFEAMLHAARLSPNQNDFALLGLLGLRIWQRHGPGHHPPSPALSAAPRPHGPKNRCCSTARTTDATPLRGSTCRR